jgi:hypothetical protein
MGTPTWIGRWRPRAALGDDAFAAAWVQGQELSPEQAVAEAMRDLTADDGEVADARA